LALVLCASAAAPGSGCALQAPARALSAGEPMAAVWRERHVEFLYRGRTSRYSCNGLREKVRALLLDLGVRRDLTIVPLGCRDYDREPSGAGESKLEIAFSSPASRAAAATRPQEGDDAIDARFEPFSIETDALRNMGIGDCELVQEFARQLLPKLATRKVKQDVHCVPDQPGGSRFLVRGEILKALRSGEQWRNEQRRDERRRGERRLPLER
jgi:hypothetical protein